MIPVSDISASGGPVAMSPLAERVVVTFPPDRFGVVARSADALPPMVAYVGPGLSGSPAIGLAGGALAWKVLSPTWMRPVRISVARRPFVTAPRVISIRPLSKYWTVRSPSGAAVGQGPAGGQSGAVVFPSYGSSIFSVAVPSGPQKFGAIASPAAHCAWKAGRAKE